MTDCKQSQVIDGLLDIEDVSTASKKECPLFPRECDYCSYRKTCSVESLALKLYQAKYKAIQFLKQSNGYGTCFMGMNYYQDWMFANSSERYLIRCIAAVLSQDFQ